MTAKFLGVLLPYGFKFHKHIPTVYLQSGHDPYYFFERGRGQSHVTPDINLADI